MTDDFIEEPGLDPDDVDAWPVDSPILPEDGPVPAQAGEDTP